MIKTLYICELCGEEFKNFHKALDHEASHIRPDNYLVKPLRYLSKDVSCCSELNDPRPYPLDIAVPMNDGAVCQYSFVGIITPAIKPEVTE